MARWVAVKAISGEVLRSSRPRGSTQVDCQRQGRCEDVGADRDAAVLGMVRVLEQDFKALTRRR